MVEKSGADLFFEKVYLLVLKRGPVRGLCGQKFGVQIFNHKKKFFIFKDNGKLSTLAKF